jgi:hypothetical protein
MQNDKPVTHQDILKWAGEVLDLVSKHTDSDVVSGQVLGAANEARRGKLYNPPEATSSSNPQGRQG